jgi:hypothetical protein
VRREKPRQPAGNGCELIPRGHRGILAESHRDQQKKVVRVCTDVTLPEVEKIHVIDGRFTALDFEKNSRVADAAEIVGLKGKSLVRKETGLLIFKTQIPCEIPECRLYSCAASAGLVGFRNARRGFWSIQVIAEIVCKKRNFQPLLRAIKLRLNELPEADRHGEFPVAP